MKNEKFNIALTCLIFIFLWINAATAGNYYTPREGDKAYGAGPEKIIALPPAKEGCYFTTPWSEWVLYEDINLGDGKSIKVYYQTCFQMGDVHVCWKITNAADFKFGKVVLNTREYPEMLDKYFVNTVLANSIAPGKSSPVKTIMADMVMLREKRADGFTGFRDTSKVKGLKVKVGPPTLYIKSIEAPANDVQNKSFETSIIEEKKAQIANNKSNQAEDKITSKIINELQILEQEREKFKNDILPSEKVKTVNKSGSYKPVISNNPPAPLVTPTIEENTKLPKSPASEDTAAISEIKAAQAIKSAAPLVTPALPADESAAPANKHKESERAIPEIKSEPDLIIDISGGITLEMVKIQAAGKSFQMGNANNSAYSNTNETQGHTVSFTRDYYIGKFEVTQGQWKKIMGSDNPSEMESGDNYPVEQISWNDICDKGGFLDKLNSLKPGGYKSFRLPTEAEWEYAARAESTFAFYWGDDTAYAEIGSYAWHRNNSSNKTHPAGSKLPNSFGLYDISGNVREWCGDWYASYNNIPAIDPIGPISGSFRVVRGGSFEDNPAACRSAGRAFNSPAASSGNTGFRLVLDVNK